MKNIPKTTTKTVLFASLIAAMILPFSMMDMAYAEQDDTQRIETKKQDIANLANEVESLFITISKLEADLANPEFEADPITRETMEDTLDAHYDKLEALQEETYSLFEIPEKRYNKLLAVQQQIFDEYNDAGILDDVFIDHRDESIQVLLHSEDFESNKDSVKSKSESIASTKSAGVVDDNVGEIEIEIKHFTPSTMAGDEFCAELGSGNAGRTTTCNKATITFPATNSGVGGFVTVGHAFQEGLNTTPSNAKETLPAYQPGPPDTDTNGTGDLPRSEYMTDSKWQAQIIGNLAYGVYDGTDPYADIAFVDLDPGETIDATVHLYGYDYDIASYTTSDPRIGQYVYKSGASTGSSVGAINSLHISGGIAYAEYSQCRGDSGSPVGTVMRGDFTVYGMHLGTGGGYYNQPDCSGADEYSRFVTYGKITGLLTNLAGQTK